MNFFWLIFIATSFFETSETKYAYERGHCEVSLMEVVGDMLQSEVRAFINPNIRKSNNKYLQYDLYTPSNRFNRQIIQFGNVQRLKNSFFNPKWPVRFSIHGWTGKSTSCSNAAIKDAYLDRGNFNVFIVDWSTYSLDVSYTRISKQLSSIAKSLVNFTKFLNKHTGIQFDQIYLIGHSAGSHIAGLAGKILYPNKYGAIFALDPAGLNQLRLKEQYRLAPKDAIYVESIHTDITLLGNPNTALSQASFFVNWGQGQPQCPNITATEFDISCDHFAAIYYFAASVRFPQIFGSLKCQKPHLLEKFNCRCSNSSKFCAAEAFMGGEPAVPKTGVYYLSTNDKPPFGLGRDVRIKKPIPPSYLQTRNKQQRQLQNVHLKVL